MKIQDNAHFKSGM